ncbi:MAG: hypothetical protein ACPF9D_06730 [Owenweeksia sp.]
MKKITLLAIGLLFSGLALAQPLSNHLYLGGSLGFSSENSSTTVGNTTIDYPKTTTYNFSPAIGYTIADYWLVGVRVGLGGSTVTDVNGLGEEVISRSSSAGASIFGRYYFSLSDQFFFYPDLGIGFSAVNSEIEINGTTNESPTTNIFRAGITPGFAYYPTTHWGIELSAGFVGFTSASSNNDNVDPNVETSNNSFEFTLNAATVNVGISYLLML